MQEHRPTALRLAAAAILATVVLGACGSEPQPPMAATREFVGPVRGSEALIALVVGEAGAPVRAYLCDGERIFEWFTGAKQGDTLQLTSKSGGRLAATVGDGAARGTISLADGRAYSFDVPPASGFAGLFEVTATASGTVEATSARGARLTGSIQGSTLDINLTSPEGGVLHRSLLLGAPTLQSARWIVSGDGQAIKGTDVHPMQTVKSTGTAGGAG